MAETPTLDQVIPSSQVNTVGTQTYQPPPIYTPPKEATVAGQMTGLLEKESPYMRAAAEGAMRTAASRGLINSSMAAGAGRKAAIEASLPIAQQDATTHANAGMTGFQGSINAAQTSLEAGLKSGLSAQDATQAKDIATKQAELQTGINAAENTNKLALISAQTTADRALQTLKEQGATERANAENAVATAKISSEEKKDALAKFAAFGDGYAKSIKEVQVDPNLDEAAKSTIIGQLNTEYKNNLRMVAALTGVEITWGESAPVSGVPSEPTAPAPTPSPSPYAEQDRTDYGYGTI